MRQHRVLSAILLAFAIGLWPASGLAQPRLDSPWRLVDDTGRLTPRGPTLGHTSELRGRIEGTVTDDRGKPLAGVAVTAHGAQLQFAVTDRYGRFFFNALPHGTYFLRAHLQGYVASRRELIAVESARPVTSRFQLTPVRDAAAAGRPVLAASVAPETPQPDAGEEEGTASEEETATTAAHSHSATSWRIRHLRRSALRDVQFDGGDIADAAPDAAVDPAQTAFSFFGDPVSGQVQFLTISAFDSPEELFSTAALPHGVAYVTLTAPAGGASTWSVQGALTEGDVSSWILGGNYASTFAGRHSVDAGISYAAQRYDGGNPIALSAMGDTSRTVGAMYGFDRFALTPELSVTGGARYAHYGYIESAGLWSPSLEIEWKPGDDEAIRGLMSQQVVAPGAEEFVPSPVAGLWMPPQRTFSPLSDSGEFRAERTRHVEIAFDRKLASFVITTRGFRQVVNDQIVTIFGLRTADVAPSDLSHYFTATAGKAEMFGWGVVLSRPESSRVRGSLAYTLAHADWAAPEAGVLTRRLSSSDRPGAERIHDLTASIETDFPDTATRLIAVYKLNSGYLRDESLQRTAGFSGRFDVQVSQRLPFVPLGTAEWELLVAVRNLFKDALDGSSLYDELLVVRPPKRIVGGLMIRF